jgi:iron complex outermembrane recepter protein
MRTKNPIALLIGWITLALAPDHIVEAAENPAMAAQDIAAGSISGIVSSTATGQTLQGAVVEIPALNRRTLTDSSGRFLLSRLPFGPVEIVISYVGLKDARQTVSVTNETQRAYTFELGSEGILMLASVSGIRKMTTP